MDEINTGVKEAEVAEPETETIAEASDKDEGVVQSEGERAAAANARRRAEAEAKQKIEQAREEGRAEAMAEETKHRVLAGELEEIGRLDPSVKSLEDLEKMPDYEKFDSLVKSGVGLSDAFRLVNFDAIIAKKAAAAEQKARNEYSAKSHMLPSQKTSGETLADVPAEEMELYRALCPALSANEIRRHYTSYISNMKG